MPRPWAWTEKKRNAYVIRYNDPILKKANGIDPKVPIVYPKDDQGRPIRSLVLAKSALVSFVAANQHLAPRVKPTGSAVLPQRHTAMSLALRWRAAHPANTSREEYLSRIQWLVGPDGIGFEYPQELTVQRINDFKLRREYRGCNRPLAYLRSVLTWSIENELLDSMPERVMGALSSPQSKRSSARLLSPGEYEQQLEEARSRGPHAEAVVHCLATYGWRPITACRVHIRDLDLSGADDDCWVTLDGKDVSQDKSKERQQQPLLPVTVALLRPLIEGRSPDEPLFLSPNGQPWKVRRERASQLTDWYGHHLKAFAPTAGNIYALKRYAVDRMLSGAKPWPRALLVSEVQRFTGHEDTTMVLRYSVTSRAALRTLVRGAEADDVPLVLEDGFKTEAEVVVWGGVDARQAPTTPDERVSYGT